MDSIFAECIRISSFFCVMSSLFSTLYLTSTGERVREIQLLSEQISYRCHHLTPIDDFRVFSNIFLLNWRESYCKDVFDRIQTCIYISILDPVSCWCFSFFFAEKNYQHDKKISNIRLNVSKLSSIFLFIPNLPVRFLFLLDKLNR